jgi:hypothetical protein
MSEPEGLEFADHDRQAIHERNARSLFGLSASADRDRVKARGGAMRIDVFTHILTPRYFERVVEILHARADQVASDYEAMSRQTRASRTSTLASS